MKGSMIDMANKKVEIIIDDTRIVAELYVDKAPEICSMIYKGMHYFPITGSSSLLETAFPKKNIKSCISVSIIRPPLSWQSASS